LICRIFLISISRITIFLSLKLLVNGYGPNPGRVVSCLSLSLACALLSKVSALLLIPSLLGVFSVSAKQAEFGAQQKIKLFGISVAVVSLMTSAALEPLAAAGSEGYIAYAIMLSVMVGLFQFSLGVLRLGVVVNFLSTPIWCRLSA